MNDLSFTWDNIHNTSKYINSHNVGEFLTWLKNVAYGAPCSVCRNHMLSYIRDNPPSKGEDVFVWTWRFHNDVNRRLGRPQYTLEEAAKRYGYRL